MPFVTASAGLGYFYMDWGDLSLRLIRAAGALTSALAGIAALLTDGAFVKRVPPPVGPWKDLPFAKYRATRWGTTLFVVILIAPTVQFLGDWIKDRSDARSQQVTAQQIRNGIDATVKQSTELERLEMKRSFAAVITQEGVLRDQTSNIATGATHILTGINTTLYPFRDVTWAYEVRLNLRHAKMAAFRKAMRDEWAKVRGERTLDKSLARGQHILIPTDDKSVAIYESYGEAPRLLIDIDSPLLKEGDPAFGAILGYDVSVDIFKSMPAAYQLGDPRFRSSDYSTTLIPPYDGDTYEMEKQGGRFPMESYRLFQVIYIPAADGTRNTDQCFVDYYWHALKSFDVLTERSRPTIVGLPDLVNGVIAVRLDTLSDYWGSEPPYTLEVLRMRIGSQELTLSSADFGPPTRRGTYLVYQKDMPSDFESLLSQFETVRSDSDTKPLSTTHLVVKSNE